MKETKYFVKMNGVEILSLLSETTETISTPRIDFSQKEIDYPVSDGSSHTLFNMEELKETAKKKKFNFSGFVKEK